MNIDEIKPELAPKDGRLHSIAIPIKKRRKLEDALQIIQEAGFEIFNILPVTSGGTTYEYIVLYK